jgi:hypothetical protein
VVAVGLLGGNGRFLNEDYSTAKFASCARLAPGILTRKAAAQMASANGDTSATKPWTMHWLPQTPASDHGSALGSRY